MNYTRHDYLEKMIMSALKLDIPPILSHGFLDMEFVLPLLYDISYVFSWLSCAFCASLLTGWTQIQTDE